eukprot:gnl/MRDRNA2_/MRDRNA2_38221_c0_seq1.p3 gnl/MRDRNA2_/MRDRNA2_38221_c0~~gnl/MRDRNA2_/MRDRNA2_38221_c0_seq1.p3  ORF type:complete len:104 (-),score=16.18 gnl/MRDRNA2_/MRDRNA2_38221_c0_seq1:12-323(-)
MMLITAYAQALANKAWAIAVLVFEDVPLLVVPASFIAKRSTECSIDELSAMAWAYAALVYGDECILHSAILLRLRIGFWLSARALTEAVWSLPLSGWHSGPVD